MGVTHIIPNYLTGSLELLAYKRGHPQLDDSTEESVKRPIEKAWTRRAPKTKGMSPQRRSLTLLLDGGLRSV